MFCTEVYVSDPLSPPKSTGYCALVIKVIKNESARLPSFLTLSRVTIEQVRNSKPQEHKVEDEGHGEKQLQ